MANFGPGINSAMSSVYAPTRVTVDWGDGQGYVSQNGQPQFPGWSGPQQPMPPMPGPSQGGSSVIAQMITSLLPMIMQLITALKAPSAPTPGPTPGPTPPPGPPPATGLVNPWTVADFNRAIDYADANNDNLATINELYDLADNGIAAADLGIADTAQNRKQIDFARQAATAMLRQFDFFSNPTADMAMQALTKADVARVARTDGNAQNLTTYELHGVTDPAAENAAITQWLDYYGLNEYGDEEGTNYAGGSPLFDEAIGFNTFIDARDYLLYQFPDRPWLAEFGELPPGDDAVAPPDDTDQVPPDDELDIPPDILV